MKNKSLILNILIFLLEVVGLIVNLSINKRIGVEYYTSLSNILILITSLLFIIYFFKREKIPKYLKILKLSSTVCISITFLIVILVLAPMYNFNYKYMLFHNELLYYHLLCPILSIITFIFFDDLNDFNKKDSYFGLSFTLLYAIILSTLNILKIVYGPYPFLRVYEQSIFVSIIWFILINGLSYLVGVILIKMYNKYRKKVKKWN